MSLPVYDEERSAKGDHNRRIALGFSLEDFATGASLHPEALRESQPTGPDDDVNLAVVHEVGLLHLINKKGRDRSRPFFF